MNTKTPQTTVPLLNMANVTGAETLRTTATEAADISAHCYMSQIALSINSAFFVAPETTRFLWKVDSSSLMRMASAMFTAGKLEGIREQRAKHRK